jgi:hypothetical protein
VPAGVDVAGDERAEDDCMRSQSSVVSVGLGWFAGWVTSRSCTAIAANAAIQKRDDRLAGVLPVAAETDLGVHRGTVRE